MGPDEPPAAPRPDWAPSSVPLDRPSAARIYDYFLGGFHHLAVDRQAAEQALAIYPDVRLGMQANRAFLRRAVCFMLDQGIDQFLDVGSGIPTVGNVHEVVERERPGGRVVYVDPIAVAHSAALLRGNPNATIVEADARDPQTILQHPEVARLLDWRRPVGLLLPAVLHFVPDEAEARGLVRILKAAPPSGSFLALSHGTQEGLAQDVIERGQRLYGQTTHSLRLRTHDEVAAFFEGWELVPPGLVFAPRWRPEGNGDPGYEEPERSGLYVGVGRKP